MSTFILFKANINFNFNAVRSVTHAMTKKKNREFCYALRPIVTLIAKWGGLS